MSVVLKSIRLMKYFLHIVIFSFLFGTAFAQEKHFVFIQSDNKQLFNVSLNGKVYSSNASGYVIIPKLTDGEYTATIGFAANAFPEQSFKYVIDKKDLGFNLKNFAEKGWGLYNLQTFAVTMAGDLNSSEVAKVVEPPKEEYKPEISFDKKKEPPVAKAEDKSVANNDAAINNDQAKSTMATTPPSAVNETEKPGTTQVIAETPKATSEPVDNSAIASVESVGAVNKSAFKKVAEVKGAMGVYLTYVDGNSKDTVQLIIPVAGKKKASESDVISGNEVVSSKETKASKKASKENDPQFLNMEVNGTKKEASAAKTSSTPKSSPTTDNAQPSLNSNCTNLASDQDFSKLKRKMAQETSDEKMINEAKKVFKNKCFTTSQVKGLSTLFLSDEGRYKFFEASYNFVTDAQLYSSLEKEFIDPTFVSRFKTMLHK